MSNTFNRTLKCSSPVELFNFVNDIDDESGFIVPFMDKVDLYLNGCPCNADEHWEQSIHEYKLLLQFDFSNIKQKLQCDTIQLFLEEQLIGEV
jgi:hypothetical protein